LLGGLSGESFVGLVVLQLEIEAILLAVVGKERIEIKELLANEEIRIVIEVLTFGADFITIREKATPFLDVMDFCPI
jgi:hypothetical protein